MTAGNAPLFAVAVGQAVRPRIIVAIDRLPIG